MVNKTVIWYWSI